MRKADTAANPIPVAAVRAISMMSLFLLKYWPTIKIAEGYEWTNSLLDPNTFEWQDLADKIKREVHYTKEFYTLLDSSLVTNLVSCLLVE